MSEITKIEWCERTWSPWEGCQKVGPGCDHCYAEARNNRFHGGNWGPGAPRRMTADAGWAKILRWQREAVQRGRDITVFPSLCDPFDNAAPAGARIRFAALIVATPNLTWLLLTKRIGNAAAMLAEMFPDGVPANVWIGATIVNQAEADRDIPKLLATPAAKRFLSMEPLLGPVRPWTHAIADAAEALDGPRDEDGDIPGIDWVIVGGESGPGARPMHPDWARSLRDQCAAADVPFLFKQWGEWEVSLDRDHDDPDWRADYTNDYIDRGKSKWLNLAGGCGFHGKRFVVMRRAGKKAAGRLLDGVTHDTLPTQAVSAGEGR